MTNWFRPDGSFGSQGFHLLHCDNVLRDEGTVLTDDIKALNLKDFGAVEDVVLRVREGFQCVHMGHHEVGGIGTGCLPMFCSAIRNLLSKKVFEVISVENAKGEKIHPSSYSTHIVAAVQSLL